MPLFPKYPPIRQYKSRMHLAMHPAQTVKSLAEFANGSWQIKLNHFLPGRVPGRKYFSGR